MTVPTPEPRAIKTIIETLLKPFTLILNPIAERIGNRLKRKPKLHIYAHPQLSAWCYAWEGYGENAKPMMQVRFTADITNDSRDEGLLVLDGYIEGTKPQIPFRQQIGVPPNTTITDEHIAVFVRPVIGEGGKDFTGNVILLDMESHGIRLFQAICQQDCEGIVGKYKRGTYTVAPISWVKILNPLV